MAITVNQHLIGTTPDHANADTASTTTSGTAIITGSCYYSTFAPAISDNKSNSYGSPVKTSEAAGQGARLHLVASATTGATHVISADQAYSYPSLFALTISGSHATPSDNSSSNSVTAGTSIQAGSVTPSEDNCLLVAVFSSQSSPVPTISAGGTGWTIDTKANAANNVTGAIAWKIQTTAGAENPTFDFSGAGSHNADIVMMAFKAAAGGATPSPFPQVITSFSKLKERAGLWLPQLQPRRALWTPIGALAP